MDYSVWILEYFSKDANKKIMVNESIFIEPTLFKDLQLFGVNNCIGDELKYRCLQSGQLVFNSFGSYINIFEL